MLTCRTVGWYAPRIHAGWDTGAGAGQTGTTDDADQLQISPGDAADAADAVSPTAAAAAAAATDGERRRAGGAATPSHSQGSVMMPPPRPAARLAALQDERRTSTAGGGGSGSLAPAPGSGTLSTAVSVTEVSSGAAGPPLAGPTAYRADSTLTLAVHRGAAAMDWASDGPAEGERGWPGCLQGALGCICKGGIHQDSAFVARAWGLSPQLVPTHARNARTSLIILA